MLLKTCSFIQETDWSGLQSKSSFWTQTWKLRKKIFKTMSAFAWPSDPRDHSHCNRFLFHQRIDQSWIRFEIDVNIGIEVCELCVLLLPFRVSSWCGRVTIRSLCWLWVERFTFWIPDFGPNIQRSGHLQIWFTRAQGINEPWPKQNHPMTGWPEVRMRDRFPGTPLRSTQMFQGLRNPFGPDRVRMLGWVVFFVFQQPKSFNKGKEGNGRFVATYL